MNVGDEEVVHAQVYKESALCKVECLKFWSWNEKRLPATTKNMWVMSNVIAKYFPIRG